MNIKEEIAKLENQYYELENQFRFEMHHGMTVSDCNTVINLERIRSEQQHLAETLSCLHSMNEIEELKNKFKNST